MFVCICLCAFACRLWMCVCARGQAQIEKVMSVGLRCPQQLGATQPKNEEVKGGWDEGVEVEGTAAGMHHESRRHSISPTSAVPLQRAHITLWLVTKSHGDVKDTHTIQECHQNVPVKQRWYCLELPLLIADQGGEEGHFYLPLCPSLRLLLSMSTIILDVLCWISSRVKYLSTMSLPTCVFPYATNGVVLLKSSVGRSDKGTQTARNEDVKTKGESDRGRRNTGKIVTYSGSSLLSGSPLKHPWKACLRLCIYVCVLLSLC